MNAPQTAAVPVIPGVSAPGGDRCNPTNRNEEKGDTSMTHHADNRPMTECTTGRCAINTPCTCEYYRNWKVLWPSRRDEPVSVQLMRRRQAALRCPRLADGRRDPISRSCR